MAFQWFFRFQPLVSMVFPMFFSNPTIAIEWMVLWLTKELVKVQKCKPWILKKIKNMCFWAMPSNISQSTARRNGRRHHRACQCISAFFVSRQKQWVGPRGHDCFSEKWARRWQDVGRMQLQCDALEAARTVWGTCLVTDFTSCQQVWHLTVISRHLLSIEVTSSWRDHLHQHHSFKSQQHFG